MGFLRRWLSQSVSIALALLFGLIAMQAPAFTREYAGALLQVAADARRDVDAREASARQFYGITAEQEGDLIAALRAREPSNAEMLERSLDRAMKLQEAHDKIEQSAPLLRPLIALRGAIGEGNAYQQPIWQLALSNYNAQLDLSLAAAIYGLVGITIGSLLAQLILWPLQTRAYEDRRFARLRR